MSRDDQREPSRDALGARIEAAREREAERSRPSQEGRAAGEGLGLAYRIAIELVASLVAGLGIGFLLDLWLGTKPWLLVVMTVLGMAAGMYNVIRIGIRMGEDGPPGAGSGEPGGKQG